MVSNNTLLTRNISLRVVFAFPTRLFILTIFKTLFIMGAFVLSFTILSSNNAAYANHFCGDPAPDGHGCICWGCRANFCPGGQPPYTTGCPGGNCCGQGSNSYFEIGGRVVDKDTGEGIPNVKVRILGNIPAYSGKDVYTDANGYYLSDDYLKNEAGGVGAYAIRIANFDQNDNSATLTPPPGFVGSPQTLAKGDDSDPAMYADGSGHQPLNSVSYENQSIGNMGCSGDFPGEAKRCDFAFKRLDPPKFFTPGPASCFFDSTNKSHILQSFTWEPVLEADSYVLRIYRSNTTLFQYIPVQSSASSYLFGECTAGQCRLTYPWMFLPPPTNTYVDPLFGNTTGASFINLAQTNPLVNGSYYATLTSRLDSGYESASVSTPIYNINLDCSPFSLEGNLHYVSIDSNDICTIQSPIDDVADMQNAQAQYDSNFVGFISTDIINSAYTFNDLVGTDGGNLFAPKTLNSDSSLPITYTLACYQDSSNASSSDPLGDTQYRYLSNLSTNATININSFNNNITGQNFGYVLNNPFENGWFTSINGDVYARSLSATIPDSVGGNLEPYIASYTDGNDVSAFIGDLTGFNSDKLAEKTDSSSGNGGKYIEFSSGSGPGSSIVTAGLDVFPSNFYYDVPTSTSVTELDDIADFISLEAGKVYTISVDDFNTVLSESNLGPSFNYVINGSSASDPGIAVLYVTGDSSDELEITNQIRSNDDSRLLIISQVSIVIDSTIGLDPAFVDANVVDLVNTDAHIQAGIISRQDIIFKTNRSLPTPTDDLIIIVEGPFVAGNNSSNSADIIFNRNLGIWNSRYPAEIVRYNPVHLVNIKDIPGVLLPGMSQSSFRWVIDEE